MDAKKENDDEDVGYRRPPKASQFKKGHSGNPAGRPRNATGRRSIASRVLGELQRLSGQPKGARVRYTTLEVIVMILKQMAAAGHVRASTLYLRSVDRHGRQETEQREISYLVVPERLTAEEWEARYSPKDDPQPDPNDM